LAHEAGELHRSLRHRVCAGHGQAELGSVRRVTERGAEGFGLRAGAVRCSGRASRRRRLAGIHVVVAARARRRGSLREVIAGRGTLGVAYGAAPDVLREAYAGDGRPRAGAVWTVTVDAAGHAG